MATQNPVYSAAPTNAFLTAMSIDKYTFSDKATLQKYSFINDSPLMQLLALGRADKLPPAGRNFDGVTYNVWNRAGIVEALPINANVGAPGAGNDITFVIGAAGHDSTGTRTYARVGERVIFNNEVTGIITVVNNTAPNATSVTVRPTNTTDAIPALVGGESVMVFTNAFDENTTGFTTSRQPIFSEDTFNTQIFKEMYSTGGSEDTSVMWIPGADGVPILTGTGIMDTERRFRMAVEFAMLLGPGTGNNTGASQPQMLGMIPWTRSNGTSISTGGAWTIATFDQFIDAQDAARATSNMEWDFWASLPVRRQIDDNIFIPMGAAGSFVYGDASQNEKKLALNYKQFERSGYYFNLNTLKILTEPDTMGLSGYPYSQWALCLPQGRTVDAITGQSVPMYELMYKGYGDRSRFLTQFYLGGSERIPVKTTSQDVAELHWRSELLLALRNSKAWGLFEV